MQLLDEDIVLFFAPIVGFDFTTPGLGLAELKGLAAFAEVVTAVELVVGRGTRYRTGSGGICGNRGHCQQSCCRRCSIRRLFT